MWQPSVCLERALTFFVHSLRPGAEHSPDVALVGYTAPHPSEDKIHFRIQTHGARPARAGEAQAPHAAYNQLTLLVPLGWTTGKSAVAALEKGLDDLMGMCEHMLSVIDAELGLSDDKPVETVAGAAKSETA